jgi:hypothetical protein
MPDELMPGGRGLCDGRESGDEVTSDYARVQRWSFTGGTVKRVLVDVSRDPGIELEREARAMLMRI